MRNDRHLAAAALALMALFSQSQREGHAAGVTAHIVAGQAIMNEVRDDGLKAFLKKWSSVYLSGTMFPDAMLNYFQADAKTNDDADKSSHGRVQSQCEAPRGVPAYFWDRYRKSCAANPTSAECERQLAFLMGSLTHMITDGPWHGQYIDITTGPMCEPCQSAIQSPNGDHYCHPGGSAVRREKNSGLAVVGGSRHNVADQDFDLCLSAVLNNKKGDFVIAQNPLVFAPASRQGKASCESGSFLDPRNGGECWQCPSGTQRTLYAVDSDRACTDNFGGTVLAKASYRRDTLAWVLFKRSGFLCRVNKF